MEEEAENSATPPPILSPAIDASSTSPDSGNNDEVTITSIASAIPSIVNMQFDEWLANLTCKNGPYTDGIHVSCIRDVANEQWRQKLMADRSKNSDGSGSAEIKDVDEPYWKHRNRLFVLLRKELADGRVKRVAPGVYKSVDQKPKKVGKIAAGQSRKTKPLIQSTTPPEPKSPRYKRCRMCFKKVEEKGVNLKCTQCEIQYHISCARKNQMLPGDLMPIRDKAKLEAMVESVMRCWKCFQCRRCTICYGQGDQVNGNGLLLCDRCDSAEHLKCQLPLPEKVPLRPWYCIQCRPMKKLKLKPSLTRCNKLIKRFITPTSAQPMAAIGENIIEAQIHAEKSNGENIFEAQIQGEKSKAAQEDDQDEIIDVVGLDEDEKSGMGIGMESNGNGVETNGLAKPMEWKPMETHLKIVNKNDYAQWPPGTELDRYDMPSLHDHPALKGAGTAVLTWSVDKVASIFEKFGFDEAAEVFKQEEIDGTALLLLTRHDIIRKLKLKLGPALKAHQVISHLQDICEEYKRERDERLMDQEGDLSG